MCDGEGPGTQTKIKFYLCSVDVSFLFNRRFIDFLLMFYVVGKHS